MFILIRRDLSKKVNVDSEKIEGKQQDSFRRNANNNLTFVDLAKAFDIFERLGNGLQKSQDFLPNPYCIYVIVIMYHCL